MGRVKVAFTLKAFVEFIVAEVDFVRVRNLAAVKDLADVCPEDSPQAHGAGFSRSVELTAGKVVGSKIFAGIADSFHFSVAGWVVF